MIFLCRTRTTWELECTRKSVMAMEIGVEEEVCTETVRREPDRNLIANSSHSSVWMLKTARGISSDGEGSTRKLTPEVVFTLTHSPKRESRVK